MQNSEIDILQEVLSVLNIKNYSVLIAVSPYLYNYLSNSAKRISTEDNDDDNNKINYFCSCSIFVDKTLKNYEYKIVRKEI